MNVVASLRKDAHQQGRFGRDRRRDGEDMVDLQPAVGTIDAARAILPGPLPTISADTAFETQRLGTRAVRPEGIDVALAAYGSRRRPRIVEHSVDQGVAVAPATKP